MNRNRNPNQDALDLGSLQIELDHLNSCLEIVERTSRIQRDHYRADPEKDDTALAIQELKKYALRSIEHMVNHA